MRKPRFFCVHIVQMVEKKNNTCFRNPAIYRSSWQVGKISISMGVFTKERHHITQIADTFWPSTSWKGKVAGRFCGGPSDAWRWWKLRGFSWKNKIKHLLVPNRYIWDHLIHFPNQPRFAGKFLRKHSIPWGLGNNVDFSQLLFQRGRLFYITFLAGKLGQVAGFWKTYVSTGAWQVIKQLGGDPQYCQKYPKFTEKFQHSRPNYDFSP